MNQATDRVIATRNLLYAIAGSHTKRAFTVCMGAPYLITEDLADFSFAPGAYACSISFIGLPEKAETVYGADGIQALELAIGSMEGYLRGLRRNYEFFLPDPGESYFEN